MISDSIAQQFAVCVNCMHCMFIEITDVGGVGEIDFKIKLEA